MKEAVVVALDVHADSIAVAVAEAEETRVRAQA